MEALGKVKGGVIVLEQGVTLPEGTTVRVVVDAPAAQNDSTKSGTLLEFPLIRTGRPGTLHLTNQSIQDLFDAEDFSAGR
jgi:hypothetical protein